MVHTLSRVVAASDKQLSTTLKAPTKFSYVTTYPTADPWMSHLSGTFAILYSLNVN